MHYHSIVIVKIIGRNIKNFIASIFLLSLISCGYHLSSTDLQGEKISLSIPYVQGDPKAQLNNTLVSTFARTGRFECLQNGGEFFLQVVLLSDNNDRIGYRYDRDSSTGQRKPNILAVENCRNITAQVTLYDNYSGDVIFGPIPVHAAVDYDYVDPGSPKDLETRTPLGPLQTIRFSYGQLNSVEGAHDDASNLLYAKLSEKIADTVLYNLIDRQ